MDSRVELALERLQRAQEWAELAAESLCPVPGFADEHAAILAARETLKALWHVVNRREKEFELAEGQGGTQES